MVYARSRLPLQCVNDLIDVDPFVSPDPLKERLQQSLIQFILNREGDSLKSWGHCFQAHVVSYLSDKVIIPMPRKASDHGVRRKFCRNSQVAKMN